MLAAICSGVCGTGACGAVGGACGCALGARGFLGALPQLAARLVQSVLQGCVQLSLAYSYFQAAVRGAWE